MYSGKREELKPSVSPVDLFHPSEFANIETFPLLLETQVLEVALTPGQCLFVPAWWWLQVHALGEDDALVVDMEFEPHSQLYNLINKGIEF